MEDSLQKEIEFFKKEVARLAKIDEVQKQSAAHAASGGNFNFDEVREEPSEKEMSFN